MPATDISEGGLRYIAYEEGTVKRDGKHVLYNDPVGHCTIGLGHLVHYGNCNGSEPEEYKRGLTDEEALALKKQDAQRFVRAINRLVKVPLTQNQFDAIVSLTFNIGEGKGGLEDSTLLRLLNSGDYQGAADQFLVWKWASGKPILLGRRQRERAIFLTPDEREEEFVAMQSLVNLASGYAIDVIGGSKEDRAPLQQYRCNGTKAQSVVFEDAGEGRVRIKFEHSGKYLDNDPNRLEVVQFSKADVPGQLWYMDELPTGGFKVRSAVDDRVLDASNWGRAEGDQIIAWAWHGGKNQIWAKVNFR